MCLGQVSKRISPNAVSYLVQTDPCPYVTYKSDSNSLVQHCKAAVDECRPLPYKTNTFDLVICNLNLHWANDLNGTLSEINRVLRPDAAIIGSIWANDSLYELRQALQLAELERRGGVGIGLHSIFYCGRKRNNEVCFCLNENCWPSIRKSSRATNKWRFF